MQTKFWGKVIKGDKRGKALGFPTANIRLHKKIGQGVYISRIVIDNNTYNSVTFIGNAKTFGKLDIKSETYILDFNKNIYGKRGNITLLKKIRTNQKFESAEKLILMSEEKDSNLRPHGPKPRALPTELFPVNNRLHSKSEGF